MVATLESLTRRLQARRELPSPEVRRTLRRVAGASQTDVAEVIGVTRQAVQLWEAGTRTPRGANLDAYLKVLRAFRRAVSDEAPPLATREPGFDRAQGSREERDDANGTAAG